MKTFAATAALAVMAAPALAQISGIPDCAIGPAIAAFASSGCDASDIACVCSNQAFIASLVPAIEAACTPAEVQTTISAAQTLCANAGVPLILPSSSSSSAVASSTSVPASSSSSASSVVTSIVYPTSSIVYSTSSVSKSYGAVAPTGHYNATKPATKPTTYPTHPVYTGAAPVTVLDKALGLVAAGLVMALL